MYHKLNILFFYNPKMHDTFTRLQTFSTSLFNSTVILLSILAVMHHVYIPKIPKITAEITSIAPLSFNADIDLTNEFVPGLKQIFLCAKYKNGSNEEMLWSKVITRKDEKIIRGNIICDYRSYLDVKGVFMIEACLYPYVGMITFKEYVKLLVVV